VSELETIGFASPAEWEAWLEREGERSPGIWVKMAKKASGVASITYAEAVEVALCFGWVDSQKAGIDDTFWRQRFTPRRARSKWSQINRAAAEGLIERGAMRAAGLREVEAARADGRWDAAYPSQRNLEVPEDLTAALAARPGALAFFASLDSANRYAILYRLHDAKRPATRAARLERFADMCAAGEKLHP
jgi:uncharacterized protein YdeI (YjbR/CyaY-like superfamily)